jgi:vacuolar-type H+-ATPase subunit I/STV1
MPREIALLDALVPTLLFGFLIAGCGSLIIDWLLTRYQLYRFIWYPALFRLAAFSCMFGMIGLWIY